MTAEEPACWCGAPHPPTPTFRYYEKHRQRGEPRCANSRRCYNLYRREMRAGRPGPKRGTARDWAEIAHLYDQAAAAHHRIADRLENLNYYSGKERNEGARCGRWADKRGEQAAELTPPAELARIPAKQNS